MATTTTTIVQLQKRRDTETRIAIIDDTLGIDDLPLDEEGRASWFFGDKGCYVYCGMEEQFIASCRKAGCHVELHEAKAEETENEDLGNYLIRLLDLQRNEEKRIDTAWGDKTPQGLGATIKRIVKEFDLYGEAAVEID